MWINRKNPVQMQKDKEALRKFGYIQELDRSMGLFSNFVIAFSVISVLTGLNNLYGYGLEHGGVACVWTFPLVGFFQLIVAVSLAEIAAIYPVTGAVYKWTTIFSNKKIGWFCGMISLLGWIGCAAGVDYGLAQFLTALLSMNEGNQVLLLTLTGVIIFIISLLNLYGIKLIRWLCDLSFFVHAVGIFLIAALLFVFRQGNTVEYLPISSLWSSDYTWAGLLQTLLMSTWALSGCDASANVSEESINPSFTVPAGMILSIAVSVFFGTLFLFSLGLAMPDVSGVFTSNQPAVIYIISKILGPIVSKYIVVIMIIVMFICGLSLHTLVIRKIYALSRDSALPGSNIWKLVSTYDVPNYSVMLTGILCFVLCTVATLLPIDALTIIAAISILSIYSSHALTIFVSLFPMLREWRTLSKYKYISIILKTIAILWQVFICLVVCYFNIVSSIILAVIFAGMVICYRFVRENLLYDDIITLSEEGLIRIENMRNAYRRDNYETK